MAKSRLKHNIGIYLEPTGEGIGGSEYVVIVLAEACSQYGDVTIIHHRRDWDFDAIRSIYGVDLDPQRVKSRRFPPEEVSRPGWGRRLSSDFTLFFQITHSFPQYCYADCGILYVLFPLNGREIHWPWVNVPGDRSSRIRRVLREFLHDMLWKRRVRSFRHRWSLSEFTRLWTQTRWHCSTRVAFPPMDVSRLLASCPAGDAPREQIISVGRITPLKRQVALAQLFADEFAPLFPAWNYAIMGAANPLASDQAYLEQLQTVNARQDLQGRLRLYTNIPREQLLDGYRSSSIFWHGMGWGALPDRPEQFEHFGIAVVEAMAAGCVPLVFHKGGPAEIVRHGEDGLHWKDAEELIHWTKTIASDKLYRDKLAASARIRARDFDRSRFVRTIFDPLPLP